MGSASSSCAHGISASFLLHLGGEPPTSDVICGGPLCLGGSSHFLHVAARGGGRGAWPGSTVSLRSVASCCSPVCCSGIPSLPTKIVAEVTRPLRVHSVTAGSICTPVFLAHCLLKSLPFPKGVGLCGVHPGWARDLVPGCPAGGARVQVFVGTGDGPCHWDARRGLRGQGPV